VSDEQQQEAVQAWVQRVEEDGRSLCETVKAATEAGVPDGLLLPALVGVFREAGMLPDFDVGGLMAVLGR
jgi:hypothetical protein